MKYMKLSLIFIVASLMITSIAGADAALSNDGGGKWQYYREITINNPGAALTDYQMPVQLSGSYLPVTRSDGADIRFTDSNDKELPYWIEDYSSGTAMIWVKVANIPANGEAKIKMYYGNPSASAVSNGDATFIFFDDFEKDAVGSDPSKWTISEKSSSFVEIVNSPRYDGSKAVTIKTDGTAPNSRIQHSFPPLIKGILEFSTRFENMSQDTSAEGAYIWLGDPIDSGEAITLSHRGVGWGPSGLYENPDAWNFISSATTGKWYRIKVIFDTTTDTYDIYVDGVLKASSVPFFAKKNDISSITFIQWYGVLQTNFFDGVVIRKYAYPELAVALGAEMPIPTPTPTPTPTITPTLTSTLTPTSTLTATAPSPFAPKSASVTGKALDAKTGEPLQGVTISIDGISAVTSSNGEFELSIDVGKHKLSLSKEGYETVTRSIIVPEVGTMLDVSLKSTSSDSSWLWIVIILLIVAIAAGIIYLIYRKKKSREIEEKERKEKEEKEKQEREKREKEERERKEREERERKAKEKKSLCMFCHAPLIAGSKFCNECGKKQEEKIRFCMNCGSSMPHAPDLCSKCNRMPPSDVDTKTCKNCSEVIPEVAKFCGNCGARQPE